ncbi:MAG: ATP-grasp domain-containing protein [Clostridia bacterium]|nr:ATP-grasp domain-containing protein [Clostridia bacterium]MBR6095579.1 ATP-grasp domain-containing protein [Oscillospiraceae bacterium]
MDFHGIRVLVTDGAGRQTLTVLHGLRDLGCRVSILCTSKLDFCYASRIPEEKLLDERASPAHSGFCDYILSLAASGKYDVLLPVGEMTTNRITLIEDAVKKHVKLACAPRSAYINAFDKQRTFEYAAQNGIPAPKTRLRTQTVEDYLETVSFPLIIKPRNGVGSIGFHKFSRREDFEPYLREHGIDLDLYVLQEYVDYEKRLGTILFMDQKDNVCMAYADEVLRWYPLDAGSACCIRSIDYPEVIQWSADLLRAMHWRGVAALSFMVDRTTGEPKLLEINGRIPASIRLSRQCGFNVAKLLLEMAFDEDVEQYGPNRVFGQVTRHFHAEIPWFLHSKDRFRCEPSWFSWRNTKDVVFWRDDPKPWFKYTIQKLFGYGEFKKKRQH